MPRRQEAVGAVRPQLQRAALVGWLQIPQRREPLARVGSGRHVGAVAGGMGAIDAVGAVDAATEDCAVDGTGAVDAVPAGAGRASSRAALRPGRP